MHLSAEIVGVIGAFLVLLAYFLLEAKKIHSDNFIYPFINLIGALCVFFSLMYSWNLAAFIIQTAWIFISLFGLYTYYKKKRKKI